MTKFHAGVLAVVVSACTIAQMATAEPPPATTARLRDPEKVFAKSCEELVALESKQPLLKGVGQIKPVLERDEKNRLKSATLVFDRNAIPPGKGPAKPKDESKPFVYVSIQVWVGYSQQPPGDLFVFEWQGQTYQMWVRVYSSDADLVKTIHKAAVERVRVPPAQK
jgi:hypothetical protein